MSPGVERTVVDRADQVHLGHRRDSRRRRVEDGDEDQRPTSGGERASETFGTVKKRMMTCGRPAVPIISDIV